MKNFKNIDLDMCNYCGTCVGICPTNALKFDRENETIIFNKSKCNNCGLCYKNCQGIEVNLKNLNRNFEKVAHNNPIMGPYNNCYIGF